MKLITRLSTLLFVLIPLSVLAENTCISLCNIDWWNKASLADLNSEIENGVEINAENKDGETALHYATTWGNGVSVEELINLGAKINSRDNRGWTPLHWATHTYKNEKFTETQIKSIQYLINAGANIDARDNLGKTPLHWAASGSPRKVELLVDAGANVNSPDVTGLTPLDYALETGVDESVLILNRGGAF